MRRVLIAEVASSHKGDIDLMKKFVDSASSSGADYVKFQSWQFEKMDLEKEPDSLSAHFKRSEFTDEMHHEILDYCRESSIKFLTTAFNSERMEFLSTLGMDAIKIGSASTGNPQLIESASKKFKKIFLSTGMHGESEISDAVGIMKKNNVDYVLLHTTSIYPTPPEMVNLRRMLDLKKYSKSIGYSDHTEGLEAIKAAIAMGAQIIEKHMCLSRKGPGRVSPFDATPEDFRKIRSYMDTIDEFLGEGLGEEVMEKESRERFLKIFGKK